MKAGIGSYAFRWSVGQNGDRSEPWQTIIKFLQKSSQMGADAVQICDNLPLDQLSEHELRAIKHLSAELNLEVEIGIRGCKLEYLQKHLDICRLLDVGILRVVLSEPDWTPTLSESEYLIRNLLPSLRANSIHLAIENHFDLLPEELVELMRIIRDDQVGICLDPFNSIYRLVHPNTTIQLLAPYAISVHVKDVSVSRYKTGFLVEGCRLGTGQLDLDFFLARLLESGHSPNLFLENWLDRRDNLLETINQEEDWVCHGLKLLQERIQMVERGLQ